jgi:hypothetical protein
LEAREVYGIQVERYFVVFADAGIQGLQVIWVIGKDKGIIDI